MLIFFSDEYKFVTLCNVWLGICGNRRKMYQFYISINNSNCKKNVLYLLDFVAFRIFFVYFCIDYRLLNGVCFYIAAMK